MAPPRNVILIGHVLDRLRDIPDDSVHCVVTSPPYWNLRDYGTDAQVWGGDPAHEHVWEGAGQRRRSGGAGFNDGRDRSARDEAAESSRGAYCECGAWRGELGLEPTPDEFVDHLVLVFREVRRVLHPSGTVWMNLGDSFAGSFGAQGREKGDDPKKTGSEKWARAIAGGVKDRRGGTPRGGDVKPKDLVGIPWLAAFALRRDGWWLRSDIVWAKPNCMPESTRDRPTRNHEYLFLLTKSSSYFYDDDAIKEPFAESSVARYALAESRLAPAATLASFGADGFAAADDDLKASQGRVAKRDGVVPQDALVVGGRKKTAETPHAGGRRQAPEPGEPGAFGEGGRKKRSVWWIPTQPFSEAHFATFPEALVEPCVLAGTSARGACANCAAPWRRVTEKTFEAQSGPSALRGANEQKPVNEDGAWEGTERGSTSSRTVGWEPTCQCESTHLEAPQPCIVLDPFFGSGTTGLVARRLGRDWLGTELKEEYAAIARKRLAPVMNERLEV